MTSLFLYIFGGSGLLCATEFFCFMKKFELESVVWIGYCRNNKWKRFGLNLTFNLWGVVRGHELLLIFFSFF